MHALHGIGPKFKEIAVGLRVRDSKISFEKLLNKMVDYESVIKRYEDANNSLILTTNVIAKNTYYDRNKKSSYNTKQYNSDGKNHCGNQSTVVFQYCEKPSHSVKTCFKIKPRNQ